MLVLRRILAFFLLVFFTPLFIISLSISQVSSIIQNPHTLTQFIEKTYFVENFYEIVLPAITSEVIKNEIEIGKSG